MRRIPVVLLLGTGLTLAAASPLRGLDTTLICDHLKKAAEAEAFAAKETPATYLKASLDILSKTARQPADNEDRRLALAAAEAFVSLAARLEDEKAAPLGDQVSYYEKIASIAPAGTLKELANQLFARSLAARGNAKGAASITSRLGVIREFHIIGPFDNERGQAFKRAFPPEEKIDLDGSYRGVRNDVSWRHITTATYDGTVDFTDYIYPNQWTAAYLLARVIVAREGDYVVKVASDDGIVVWVDGVKAIANRARRPMTFDQDSALLHLTEGTHDILLKVLQEKGDWATRLRLIPTPGARLRPPAAKTYDGSTPTGSAEIVDAPLPFDGVAIIDDMLASMHQDVEGKWLRLSLAPDAAAGALKEVGEDVSQGQDALIPTRKTSYWQGKLGGAVQGIADNEISLLYFIKGIILGRRRVFDVYSEDRPVRELLKAASALWPENPAITYHHALSLYPVKEMEAEKNYNPFLKELRRLVELVPGHAGALTNLAFYYGTIDNTEKAHEYATAINDKSHAKPFVMAIASQNLGWYWQIDSLLSIYGDKDAVCLQGVKMLINRSRSPGRLDKALKVASAMLRRAYTDPEIWIPAFEMMIDSGRLRDAASLVKIEALLDPASRDVMQANLRLAEASRNYRSALAAVRKRLDLCPQDHTLYEQLGRYLSLTGDKEQAFTAFRQALDIEPTYTPLLRYMEVVEKTEDYAEPYLVDAAALAKEAFKTPAADDKYPAEVLLDQAVETIGKDGKASSTIHRVIRLLNPQGVSRFGSFTIGYTPGEQEVKVLAARVYRPDGRVDDAEVMPARAASYGGRESRRTGYPISLPNPNPGDVVEFRVRTDDRKLSFFGSHYEEIFLFGDTVPVKRSEYVLIAPDGYPISYHVSGGNVPFTRKTEAGKTIYHWRIDDVPSAVDEPSMPRLHEIVPTLYASKFSSWKGFGQWYWSLIRDQHTANDAIKNKVAELTKNKAATWDKIRAIYHFVTNDIEYVAWEFGVHGFKPYDASAVFERKFGDCKDKATLLKVMLAQIGVPAHQALVRAAGSRIRQDMTLPLFRHFNHAICYVPQGRDYPAMWLDGTAQFFPFGSYPSMDADRTACVVEEADGGALKSIPPLTSTDNVIDMRVNIDFQAPQGDNLPAVAEIHSRARGQAEAIIRHNFDTKPKEILERVYSRRLGKCTAVWHKFPVLNDMYEPCDYSYGLDLPRMAHKDGEGFSVPIFSGFLRPRSYADLVTLDKRIHPLVLSTFMDYSAAITMTPPPGYSFAKLPADAKINSDGVRFVLSFTRDGPKVVVTEIIGIDAARVPPDDYPAFRNHLLLINQSEKQQLLLLPSGGSGTAAGGNDKGAGQ